MNVSLTPELETFVQNEVSSGLYQTASEVIRAGLRQLKREQEARLPRLPRTREELEAQLLESIESLDRGEGVSGDQVLANLRKRSAAQRKAQSGE
jgi:antitoxin ParD1/3/4